MVVLGISGTPRPGGNSEHLLDAALAPFEEAGHEALRFLLSEKRVAPCTGCEACVKEGACSIRGDDMGEAYAAFARCDAILIAAPAYYRNVPAQLKALMDRTYGAKGKPLLGKAGGAIAVGRGSSGGQAIVLTIIHNYLLSCGVACVPGELNGVSAVADKPGDILSQPVRLGQAKVLGENILRFATPREVHR